MAGARRGGRREAPASVAALSWSELNEALLGCEDMRTLGAWLDETVESTMSLARALRVHARLNLVRRRAEMEEIKWKVMARQRSR